MNEAEANKLALRALADQWQAGREAAWQELLACIEQAGGKDKHPDDCPLCRASREYLAALA